MHKFIQEYTKEYIEVLKTLNEEKLVTLHKLIDDTKKTNNSIYVIGNGGSSASASHWVCDFNKGINSENSERLKLYSLTDNVPLFSALGNDVSYDEVFVEQLKNYLEPGDLVIGLSVSGNSNNIVKALSYANENSGHTFSIIGDYNGTMKDISDYTLIVPSKNYGIVEDIHMYVCHVISQYMYSENKQ